MSEKNIYIPGDQVAYIPLKGEPYQRTVQTGSGDVFVDSNKTLDALAENTGYSSDISETIAAIESHIGELLSGDGFYGIDRKIKHGEDLDFDEAFSLGTFVCSSLNRPLDQELHDRIQGIGPHETHLLQATALLSAMSAKEAYRGLTPEEIAGTVAATIATDTVVRTPFGEPILAFGGMGGDKGYKRNGDSSKLFSLSTLSAIALSADGPVHKHHSYPNTSRVAGQSAIEAMGARSDFASTEVHLGLLQDTSLNMSSCHDTRTLHTLSHLLRGETINHVIGPLAFTMSADTPIQAMIGVNEKIHPETIVQSLAILNKTGFQKYDNSVVYCGTNIVGDSAPTLLSPDAYQQDYSAKEHVRIDEVAPPPFTTLAAFLVNGENAGSYLICPEDFYDEDELASFAYSDLLIPNDRESILFGNSQALSGDDKAKSMYLAMTVGLGLFTRHALQRPERALDPVTRTVNRDCLRFATKQALDLIESGQAKAKADQYVQATQAYAGIR